MFLLLCLVSVILNYETKTSMTMGKEIPILPDTYKDIFVKPNAKTTLGTMRSTCWARGGICIDIRECPELQIDVTVPGCNWGYKVCCKVMKVLSPTVDVARTSNNGYTIEDLNDPSIHIIAEHNSELLSIHNNQGLYSITTR